MIVIEVLDVNTIKENDIIKFINLNKTLVDGKIKKVSNDYLGITINTKQDTYKELSKGQTIELILVREHEALKCTSVIIGSKQNGFEQAIIISIPKLILGIERREFERIHIVMNMEYSPLPFEIDYDNLSSVEAKYFRRFRKTYTLDISAGGVSFNISKYDPDNNFALVNLFIKDEKITTLCKKVRTEVLSDSTYNKVAFKFTDIKGTDRQLILDYILEKSKGKK